MMLATLVCWTDAYMTSMTDWCFYYWYVGLMLVLLVCWTDACITSMLDCGCTLSPAIFVNKLSRVVSVAFIVSCSR